MSRQRARRWGESAGRSASALVDVADEQVRAAGVAQYPDLMEDMGDGGSRVRQPASAQVIAVGNHEGGPVLGGFAGLVSDRADA